MTTDFPFVGELRAELLTHAPAQRDTRHVGQRSVRRARGPLVALAVFAVVVAVGATVWILRPATVGPQTSEPIDLASWDMSVGFPAPDDASVVVAAVEAIPGVTEVQFVPDISILIDGDAGTAPDYAALLIRIQDDADPVDVASQIELLVDGRIRFSAAIIRALEDQYLASIESGAESIDGSDLLLRPAPGPAARFDTSQLGREVSLTVTTEIDDLVARIDSHRSETLVRDVSRPILFVGRVEELDADLAVFPAEEVGYCDFVFDANSSGGGCGIPAGALWGVTSAGSGTPVGHVVVFVPPETAAVVVTGRGDGPVWQRPVGGWALLPMALGDGKTVAVDAYDELGSLIGHWEQTL